MKIYKIVLTGGPCAGKTTAVKVIKQHLKERGIPCLIVPETATELIPNLIMDKIDNILYFQSLIMKRQLVKEQDTVLFAEKNYTNYDKCVIICDRGIVDNLVYLKNEQEFQMLLTEHGLRDYEVLREYNMVIDLLSVASCKPEAYNLSNEARKESVEQAAILDARTSMAWSNHYNLRLVSSDVPIEEEMKTIINLVDDLIDDKQIITRQIYEVDLETSDLSKYDNMKHIYTCDHEFEINNKDYICRVSVKGFSEYGYFLEVYKIANGKKTIIYTKPAFTDDLDILYSTCKNVKSYNKEEINFVENQMLYNLSIYDDKAYLEVQKSTTDKEIIIPEGIKIKNNYTETDEIKESISYIKKLVG